VGGELNCLRRGRARYAVLAGKSAGCARHVRALDLVAGIGDLQTGRRALLHAPAKAVQFAAALDEGLRSSDSPGEASIETLSIRPAIGYPAGRVWTLRLHQGVSLGAALLEVPEVKVVARTRSFEQILDESFGVVRDEPMRCAAASKMPMLDDDRRFFRNDSTEFSQLSFAQTASLTLQPLLRH
jgi:hypothetical protein